MNNEEYKPFEDQKEAERLDNTELYAPDPVDGHNMLHDLPRITDEDMVASGYVKVGDEWIDPPRGIIYGSEEQRIWQTAVLLEYGSLEGTMSLSEVDRIKAKYFPALQQLVASVKR